VTFTEEVWDAGFWGEQLSAHFDLAHQCQEPGRGVPELSAHVHAAPYKPGPQPSLLAFQTGVTGEANLAGYTGTIESKGVFNGQRLQISFTSHAFRNRAWRCAFASTEGLFSGWYFKLGFDRTAVRYIGRGPKGVK
jgi:hypothetical protein